MAEPKPDWLTQWGNSLIYAGLSIFAGIAGASAWLWRTLLKIERTEALVLGLQADFAQHENEDYYEFGLIQQKLDPLPRVEEATDWIKQAINELKQDRQYAHERIAEHDIRNREAAAQYELEVSKMIEQKEKRIHELETMVATLSK